MTRDKEDVPSVVTQLLLTVGGLGILGSIALLWMVNAGMFMHYDFTVGARVGGPSAVVAVIPLAIGVACGIAAAITWTIESRNE